MFSTLRTRFGIPGVISVMALVFAMFGGAYAASNSSDGGKATASAKAKKGPRGPKGATGPAGPAGPAGPKGDAGVAGANGKDGTSGAAGNTVRSGAGAPEGSVTGDTGDFYIRTSTSQIYGPKTGADGTSTGWGTSTDLTGEDGAEGPAGEAGEPWTAGGTLPEGSTETGSFVVSDETGDGPYFGYAMTAISFTIPLQSKNCVIDPGPPPFEMQMGVCAADIHVTGENGDATCTGNAASPTAPSGKLCFYESGSFAANSGNWGDLEVAPLAGLVGSGVSFGAGTFGAFLAYPTDGDAGYSGGSWAVTG